MKKRCTLDAFLSGVYYFRYKIGTTNYCVTRLLLRS